MDKNTKKVPYFPFGIPKCFNFSVQRIQVEEKTEKAAPEISVNLDSEYFKWKEQEGKEEDSEDEKQPAKKGFFGKFMK